MRYHSSKNIIILILLAFLPQILCAQDGSVPPRVINGISIPGNFPGFSSSINEVTAPGFIFITNSEGAPYLMILHNDGSPYYYQELEEPSLDFRVQSNGLLSHWIGGNVRGYMVMDQHFQNADTFRCQNGFDTDEHEFQLLPNGNSLLIAREEKSMTEVDPDKNPNSIVIGNHIQEIDNEGNVVFQWLCWDYFLLEDSYLENFDAFQVDYIHMNSIAVDYDGNLLISSRHLSECTKIDRQSGEIIWRLGGKNNQFTFINDPDLFSQQHDFRPVPGKPGHYTLFDNGNLKDPKYSRAVEFRLDTLNMLAEKVWEYRASPDKFSRLMGNVQRLPNGNSLINWGASDLPKVTELTPDSLVVYEADFSSEMVNYRSYRFEFDAYMHAPHLHVEPYPDRIRLLFNKFGDEAVDYYNIYGGESPEQMQWMDSTSLPWIDLLDLKASSFFYLEVTAVDSSGLESGASTTEKVYVRNSLPGDNLIVNGDFSDDDAFWTHINDRDGSSSGSIMDSIYRFNILNPGVIASDVQLYQSNIPLIKGKEYILELDARADVGRTINVELERAGSNWFNYSKHGQSYIGKQFTHIAHTFTMKEANDLKAKLVINGGGSDIDFEVKNISLRQTVVSGIHEQIPSNSGFHCYPNPANKEVCVSYRLESSSDTELRIFTLSGQPIKTLNMSRQVPGRHDVYVDTEKLTEGSYLIHLETANWNHSGIIVVQH